VWCDGSIPGASAGLDAVMAEREGAAAAVPSREELDGRLVQLFADLREAGTCTDAAAAFCGRSLKWFYRKPGGSRAARVVVPSPYDALPPAAEVVAKPCCQKGCASWLNTTTIDNFRKEDRAAPPLRRDGVRKRFLMNEGSGALRGICREKAQRCLPIGYRDFVRLCAECEADATVAPRDRPHGLREYLGLHPPANKVCACMCMHVYVRRACVLHVRHVCRWWARRPIS
jgi:hypothetical protein